MAVNRGKQFETQIFKAASKVQNLSIDRFLDPMAGFAGIKNICDFGIYQYPFYCYLECKSCYDNTLNFHNITDHQWKGLLEKSTIFGVKAGVIIWFISHDITTYIPIQQLEAMKQAGLKSVNIKDIREDNIQHYIIPAVKKRVLFDYDLGGIFKWEMC